MLAPAPITGAVRATYAALMAMPFGASMNDANALLPRAVPPASRWLVGAVLAWRPAKSPAGCLCSEPSRHHKWQAVLETLHFALRSAGDTAITLP